MNLEFENIEENGLGKMFALLEDEPLPVGQLFYNIDHAKSQIVINYLYIPRKYWSNSIQESLISELQNTYPDYSINMKENIKEASLLKESPARSKAQFRYMQGICNGSIEPPKGMTRAKACEFVEGQKDYKELPDKKESTKKSSYDKNWNLAKDRSEEGHNKLWRKKEMHKHPLKRYKSKWKVSNKYTHLNDKGQPCNCKFYKSDYKESAWKVVLASKLDKIIKDDPKVLRTDEGKKVLDWMKTLPEQVDDFLPWMVREYKKRRLAPAMAGNDVIGMERTVQGDSDIDEVADGTLLLDGENLAHWADWFNSTSPTRRGVDIMQLTTEQLQDKIKEWDEELASNMEDAVVYEGAGTVIYVFPDGWTMRDVSPEECRDEGEQMGHCVGGHGYPDAIRRGDIKIISLRDPENRPHATLEVKSSGHVEQVQGKQNLHPISKYRRRVRTFIEDPQGFQNLFKGKKAIQEESYPLRSWNQLGEDLSYYSLSEDQEIPPVNEEEFGSEWNDPRAPGHPAGSSSYSRGLRGTHYGIIPGGTSLDYESIINQAGDSSPALIKKLYEIAEKRNEIPLLETALNNQEDKVLNPAAVGQSRNNLLVLPNFEDQSRNGWRDVFEKETGATDYSSYTDGPEKNVAEQEYKRLWEQWIQNLYSGDYEKLLNNLIRINSYKNDNPEYLSRQINELLGDVNIRNTLRSLIKKVEMGDPFESLRPSFGLNPVVPQEQMSLISKWTPVKKKIKISMPKNPEELQEWEIITDDFVRGTRFKALEYGFQEGYRTGWRDGQQSIRDAIGNKGQTGTYQSFQYGINNDFKVDRRVVENQTTFPETEGPGVSDYGKENARKTLNTVIDLVPSNFLKDGRKYTPAGKQFSKKKFIETLISDFKSVMNVGYQVGFKDSQEKTYRNEEIADGIFEGPSVESPWREYEKYVNDRFLKELEKTDAETFAYKQEKDKVIDEINWEEIYKKEILDRESESHRRLRWHRSPKKHKEFILNSWQIRNEHNLEKLREKLKSREQAEQ